jgi:hypothetical protein
MLQYHHDDGIMMINIYYGDERLCCTPQLTHSMDVYQNPPSLEYQGEEIQLTQKEVR